YDYMIRQTQRFKLLPYTTLFRSKGWEEYIIKKTINKSLLYVYRPKHVQELALYFNKSLPDINSDKLDEIASILEKYVYEDYFMRSEEHTSELQSRENLVCRLLLE